MVLSKSNAEPKFLTKEVPNDGTKEASVKSFVATTEIGRYEAPIFSLTAAVSLLDILDHLAHPFEDGFTKHVRHSTRLYGLKEGLEVLQTFRSLG